jgi:amidohydrolase
LERIKKEIIRQVDSIKEDLFALSKRLFENPEIAYQEHRACQWLSQFLEERGFEVEVGVGGLETAFFARPKNVELEAPRAAFLAEYDALEKIGHGCGHNLIAASSLGAAIALKESSNDHKGSFVIVGTPAEEGGGGKARLADAGVFKGIDMALMVHPGHRYLAGEDSLGRIKAKIEFIGRTAHASAAPELGRNALDAIVCAYNNISALRQQIAPDGRIHGVITHGGDAPNVIPDYTAGLFYIRAASKDYLKKLFQRFQDCCQGAGLATGCECNVEIQPPSLDPVKRNKALESVCVTNMEAMGFSVETKKGPSGSTDLGNLSQIIPALQPFVPICDEHVPLHSVDFAKATQSERGKSALLDSAKILALTAYDYLSTPDIQKAVADEFGAKGG